MKKLPDGWKEVRLGEIMTFKNGLNFSQNLDGQEFNFLGVGNFKSKNVIKDSSEFDKIYLTSIDESYLLCKNDLVFVRSNGSKDLVGRCVLIDNDFQNTTYSGFCIRGRLTSEKITSSKYISELIEAGFLQKKLKKENRGTNISNLNQDILSSLELPIPPLAEQKAIAETLSVWDSAIEKTERLISEKEKMFEGNL